MKPPSIKDIDHDLIRNCFRNPSAACLQFLQASIPVSRESSYYDFIRYMCTRRLNSLSAASTDMASSFSSWAISDESKHRLDYENLIVLWIGRFRSLTGYGKATRDFFSALYDHKPPKIKTVGLDTSNCNLLGDTHYVRSQGSDDKLVVKPANPNDMLHVIFHEACDKFNQLELTGKCTFSAWTIHEDPTMIFGKSDLLTLPQHLFVASRWNKKMLVDFGLADDYISIIPHIAPKYEEPISKPNQHKTTRFLAIMSNTERKNIRTVLNAFLSLIDKFPDEKIELTLKLPARKLSSSELHRKVLPASVNSLKELPNQITVIAERLTDAEMLELINEHDCVINIESLKGFDLDSLFALSIGKQCISTLSGGNSEYQDASNTYIVERSLPEYFSGNNFSNHSLYSKIKVSQPTINALSKQILLVHSDLKNSLSRNTKDMAFELAERFSFLRISGLFYHNILKRDHDFDVLSLKPASVTFNMSASKYTRRTVVSDKMSATELLEFRSKLKSPSEYGDINAWLTERRKQISSIGTLPLSEEEREHIAKLRNKYEGKRCFVIGNGPSLNKMDLSKLKSEYTFAANKFYYKIPELNWTPSFYTCLDWTVTPDDAPNLQKFFSEHPEILKFVPTRFLHLFDNLQNLYYYNSKPAEPSLREKFEIDATQGIRGGGTVATAMIQLAAYLGFKDIFLIGTDVSYKIPDSVKQTGPDKFNTGTKLYLESTKDDDPNHFCSNYFGKGTKWHDPNVPEMKRGFRNTYLAARYHGINLINATIGGELNQIPRVSYDDLF